LQNTFRCLPDDGMGHILPTEQYVWVAAVDAFGAADRIRAGAAEGGFILRDECMSRVIKFDSKQTKTEEYPVETQTYFWLKRTLKNFGGTEWRGARERQRQKKFVLVVVGTLEDSEVSSQDHQVATSILTALGPATPGFSAFVWETQAVHGQPRRAAMFIVTRRDCLTVGTRAFVNR
jgi:hypothetical protein